MTPTGTDRGQADKALAPELAVKAMNLFVDHVTATITSEFEARGVDSVLLKGPAFARLLYDSDYERAYTDTDLLVRSADVGKAEEGLRARGFARVDRDGDWIGPGPKYAHTFRRADRALVDLHWHLSGATASPEDIWRSLAEHRISLEVGGRRVAALDEPASVVLLALHAAHHGTSRAPALTELERAVDRLAPDVWGQAARLADELGASVRFAAGLRLTCAGANLADGLGLADPKSVELWLKAHPGSYGTWLLDRLTHATGARARLAIGLRVIVPTRQTMRTFVPLARRGRTGLVLAYLSRPVRLVRHAGPSLREWVHARRAVAAQRRSR